jgi:hypothetical protein
LIRLRTGRPGFDYRQRQDNFSSPPRPDRLWVPPSLLLNGYGGGALSLGVKRLRLEVDHSLPSRTEVQNRWSYTSIPPIRLHSVTLSQAQVQRYFSFEDALLSVNSSLNGRNNVKDSSGKMRMGEVVAYPKMSVRSVKRRKNVSERLIFGTKLRNQEIHNAIHYLLKHHAMMDK